jgi:predicted nucleic acid-binding Zn ribbon protein
MYSLGRDNDYHYGPGTVQISRPRTDSTGAVYFSGGFSMSALCVVCGELNPIERQRVRYKTCSDGCRREFYRRRSAEKKKAEQAKREAICCPVCGNDFKPLKPTSSTCSRKCANTLIARRTALARGEKTRGRGEGKAYRKLMNRHEHRVIMEQMIGRPLENGEVVHHKDGNIHNNDPENLELLPSQADHARKHSTKNRKCYVDGCDSKHFCHGYCRSHYRNALKAGELSLCPAK